MSQSKILQFCYLLETQTAPNLDEIIEDRVSGTICQHRDDQPLPWIEDEERTPAQLSAEFPRHNIITSTFHEYQIYIGLFSTLDVLKFWQRRLSSPLEVFSDLAAEDDHRLCYGSFRVSGEGQLIKDSLKLTGAPLLLGQAKNKTPEEIAENWCFSDDLYRYKKAVGVFFESSRQQLYEESKQVTGETIEKLAHHIIYGYSNWRPDEFKEDSCQTRLGEIGYWVQFGPREKDRTLMSSFLLRDIEHVGRFVSKGNRLGSALKSYLSDQTPERINLDSQVVQQQVLSPSSIPLGRWPANPTHHLSLQQQCAVNLAMLRTVNGGLFSVNGPPGTGKTTMLRDIVANIVVQRAARMAMFSNPNDAFREPKRIGNEMSPDSPYLLDESLVGYEIVVASSNNGAVENISKELPAIGAVAEAYRSDARYFSKTACRVLQEEAWGLFSAVLGKKENCLKFTELLCPKMATPAAADDFLSALKPPFKLNWRQAKASFFELKHTVETLIAQRQYYESAVQTYREVQHQLQVNQTKLTHAQDQLEQHQ